VRRTARSRRARITAITFSALVVVAAAITHAALDAPATATLPPVAGESSASTPGGATGAVAGVRQVDSPGHVTDDIQLSADQCHVRVLNGAAGDVLPDRTCTPGAVDPAVTQATIQRTICVRGYTATVRPPESDTGRYKHESLAEYGMTYRPTIEYDHLVPLELGGANSVSNLWPEPNTARAAGVNNPKDTVENALRDAVCGGRISLSAAQQAIATNWTTAAATLGQ
jgi:hypothetical protein